jgi:hypothetical protein
MANEDQKDNEIKPRAITYAEVKKAGGETGSLDRWQKIGEITGAGHVPLNADGEAAIDITGLAPSKVERIEKLLANAEEKESADKAEEAGKEPAAKSRGGK